MKPPARQNPPDYWVSYADLMGNLLLVFLLVLVVAIAHHGQLEQRRNRRLGALETGLAEQRAAADRAARERALLERTLGERQRDLAGRRRQVDDLSKLRRELADTLAHSREAHAVTTRELAVLQARHAALTAHAADLEARLRDTSAELGRSQAELTTAAAALQESRQTLSVASGRLTSTTQELAALTGERDRLAAQVATLLRELQSLHGVRRKLVEALVKEFPHGYARVDPRTGAIRIQASVLFDVGKADLKAGSEQVLGTFLQYLSAFLRKNPALREDLAALIVEGHTDTTFEYDFNLGLSVDRALRVARFLLARSPDKAFLEKVLSVNGRSESEPIYAGAAGKTVDLERSRRIEIKFVLRSESVAAFGR